MREGATGETRTPDLLITNQMLYQLSHSGGNLPLPQSNIRPSVQTSAFMNHGEQALP